MGHKDECVGNSVGKPFQEHSKVCVTLSGTRPPVAAVGITVIFTVTKTVTENETVIYFQQYFSGDLSVLYFFKKLCFKLSFEFTVINFCYTRSQAVKPLILFYRV